MLFNQQSYIVGLMRFAERMRIAERMRMVAFIQLVSFIEQVNKHSFRQMLRSINSKLNGYRTGFS